MGKTLLAFLPGDRLVAVIEQMEFVKFAPNTISTRPRLIGELDRIRAAGIGTCDEEFAVGIRSIAAPVCVHTGEVTAAISVHVHTSTLTLKQLIGQLGPGLRHTADEISLQAGYRRNGT
jgi:IclR family pca regulon transcriptional regulator